MLRFKRKEKKLSPKYMEPFEIVERIKKVHTRTTSLSHNRFTMYINASMLNKYVSGSSNIRSQKKLIEVHKDPTYEGKLVKI